MSDVLRERFWTKVRFGDGCWEWTACRDPHGYGRFNVRSAGRDLSLKASRVAYGLVFGPIRSGHNVLHVCDNPGCVRPSHLFTGTQADNVRDMTAKGRARKARGERAAHAKLTATQVRIIRERYAAGNETTRSLGAEFGVSNNSISAILRRKSWAAV